MAPIPGRAVPWGRSLEEYSRMFDLSARDLAGKILDCAAGPASFNAEMHRRGASVVSCDPLYEFSADGIRKRIGENYDMMVEASKQRREQFIWQEIQSPEHLGQVRMQAMNLFLKIFQPESAKGATALRNCRRFPFAMANSISRSVPTSYSHIRIRSRSNSISTPSASCAALQKRRAFSPFSQVSQPHIPRISPPCSKRSPRRATPGASRVPYEFQKGANEMLRVSPSRF